VGLLVIPLSSGALRDPCEQPQKTLSDQAIAREPDVTVSTSDSPTLAALESHDQRNDMAKRMKKLLVALTAFAALATGGAVFAQAQSQPAGGSENPAAVDRDSIQSGDQTTPDKPAAATASRKASAGSVTRKSSAASQPEPAGSTEKAGAESTEQPGAESTADSDGPGGHADEPGNANANHEVQGVE
jgi:hypothetical protein